MTTGVSLIEVPFMAGDAGHPAAAGPERLARAAGTTLAGARIPVGVARVTARPPPAPAAPPATAMATASAAVGREVAAAVRGSAAVGRFPLVLAGSCDAAIGVTAALSGSRCGVVWIDAHADFNTPASSVSGFFPGMSLAVVTGHCHRRVWARAGGGAHVAEDDVVLIGVRSLSPPEEARRLRRSAIDVVDWTAGGPGRDVETCLDRLAGRVERIYLHVDNDAFDPDVAPGIVDAPVPGGLTLADMLRVVAAATRRFEVAAATLATYTPAKDRDDRTLRADLRIVELLGEHLARR